MDDILEGLRAPQKHLPCRLLYDARGAQLFEQITTLDAYYLTRAELALLEASLPAIAEAVGPHARVIEPGSGAGRKTRMLLDALPQPAVYVPIDVSHEQLGETAEGLRSAYPGLVVAPVHADYTQAFAIPQGSAFARSVVFFPGSTIGNFEPTRRAPFRPVGKLAGPGSLSRGGGFECRRARSFGLRLPRGVTRPSISTSCFTEPHARRDVRRRCVRASRDLGATLRIEMHLVSRRRQTVTVGGEPFAFERGEPIVTEHCYKHRPEVVATLLDGAGWHVRHVFPDPHARMRLWLASR